MKKRSFFFKEYLTHFILIVVAFTLAGSVFYHQMASYALRAKQTELPEKRNCSTLAQSHRRKTMKVTGYATTENCRANPARISPAMLRQSPEFLHPLRRYITSGGNASVFYDNVMNSFDFPGKS